MHRAFFTFAAFVTGSMMEDCPGHLVHLVYSATKRCPSRAANSSLSNSNSPSSVYITPPVAAVSFVTSRRRHLVVGLVPGTAGLIPGLVAISSPPDCRHLSFSSRPHHLLNMADVDCIRTFVRIHYPTGRRRLVTSRRIVGCCRPAGLCRHRPAGLCRHPPLL